MHALPLVVGGPVLLMLALVTGRVAYHRRGLKGAAVLLAMVGSGIGWAVLRDQRVHPHYFGTMEAAGEPAWLLRLSRAQESASGYWRGSAEVLGMRTEEGFRPLSGRLNFVLAPDSGVVPVPGDVLWAVGHPLPLDATPDPGGFDAKKWAADQGIHHELFVAPGGWVKGGHMHHWTDPFERAREGLAQWLSSSGAAPQEMAIVKALLLGQRDDLDRDQRDAFARSGTMHVLAVSGMHVGLVFGVLALLMGRWGGRTRVRLVRGMVVLAVLWAYAGLTGGSASVVRATAMFSMFVVAGMVGRRSNSLNSLFASAFFMLLWDPLMLKQLGFQLSFLAVLGIILFHDPISELWEPRTRLGRYAWALLVVSVSAQLMTAPLAVHVFKAFPVWFLPANFAVSALVALIVYGGLLLVLVLKVPVLGKVVAWILGKVVCLVGTITGAIASWPGAYPDVRLDGFQMLLIYAVIASLGAWWSWRWRWSRPVALACCVAFLVVWGGKLKERNEREAVVVYADRRELRLGVVVGRSLILAGEAPSERVLNTVQAHQRAWGVRWTRTHALEDLVEGARLRTAAGEVMVVGSTSDTLTFQDPMPCTLLLHGRGPFQPEALEHMSRKAERVVLAPDIPPWERDALRPVFLAQGIPVHDVAEDGAFILAP